jgi:hypothetical protein
VGQGPNTYKCLTHIGFAASDVNRVIGPTKVQKKSQPCAAPTAAPSVAATAGAGAGGDPNPNAASGNLMSPGAGGKRRNRRGGRRRGKRIGGDRGEGMEDAQKGDEGGAIGINNDASVPCAAGRSVSAAGAATPVDIEQVAAFIVTRPAPGADGKGAQKPAVSAQGREVPGGDGSGGSAHGAPSTTQDASATGKTPAAQMTTRKPLRSAVYNRNIDSDDDAISIPDDDEDDYYEESLRGAEDGEIVEGDDVHVGRGTGAAESGAAATTGAASAMAEAGGAQGSASVVATGTKTGQPNLAAAATPGAGELGNTTQATTGVGSVHTQAEPPADAEMGQGQTCAPTTAVGRAVSGGSQTAAPDAGTALGAVVTGGRANMMFGCGPGLATTKSVPGAQVDAAAAAVAGNNDMDRPRATDGAHWDSMPFILWPAEAPVASPSVDPCDLSDEEKRFLLVLRRKVYGAVFKLCHYQQFFENVPSKHKKPAALQIPQDSVYVQMPDLTPPEMVRGVCLLGFALCHTMHCVTALSF